MAGEKKNLLSVVGIIVLVIGVGLVVWGYQLSGSVGSQLTNAITGAISGSQAERVVIISRGGAAAVVTGLFLLLQK